jgi:hypothetical protein
MKVKTWDKPLLIGDRPDGVGEMCRLMTGPFIQGGQGATPQREPFGDRSTVPYCRVVERSKTHVDAAAGPIRCLGDVCPRVRGMPVHA